MNSLHHEKYYKPIGINLSRQTNTSIPKKKVEKLKEDDDAKKKKNFYSWFFYKRLLTVTE